jgi:hypothetical protein
MIARTAKWATRTDGGPRVEHQSGAAAYNRALADKLNGATATVIEVNESGVWETYAHHEH